MEKITWGTFLLFGVLTLFAVVWAIFFLPETSGVTLEAIGKSYEGDLVARSVADLFPAKRRAYRAQLLRENGGTADDGFLEETESKDQNEFVEDLESSNRSQEDSKSKDGKKDQHQVVCETRDADLRD